LSGEIKLQSKGSLTYKSWTKKS